MTDYLAGSSDWPVWMNEGASRYTVGIADVGKADAPGKEDRIYFLPADILEKFAVPKWAATEILKALDEKRRVFVCGPDRQTVEDVIEAVLPRPAGKPN